MQTGINAMMGAIDPGFEVAESPVDVERMSSGMMGGMFVASQGRGGLEPGLAGVKWEGILSNAGSLPS